MGALIFKAHSKTAYEDVKCPEESLWDIKTHDIDDQEVTIGQYLDDMTSAILFVNVATKWGLTEENYEYLVEVYEELKELGLQIIAQPCNQFF